MRLNRETQEIFTSGIDIEHKFSINSEDMPVIFDILRSKLYNDPIGSIVREITSNARDANREAGKADVPIEIVIGDQSIFFLNNFDSQSVLVIRDFGLGISPERMKDVYSKYGASTKRLDDLQTGGFGLGAKTPFAYTDMFSVNVIIDGVIRSYSVYLDENKLGSVSLMSENESDRPNGTEVIIPFNIVDKHKFISAIQKYTKEWNPRPVVKGMTYDDIKHHQPFLTAKDDSWKLYPGSTELTCVIDGIPTPSTPFHKKGSVFMKFDIGELSLTASREGLHYDSRTTKLLEERSNKMIDEINDFFQEKISKAPTLFQAHIVLKNIINNSVLNSYRKNVFSWNGISLKEDSFSVYGHKVMCHHKQHHKWISIDSKCLDNFLICKGAPFYVKVPGIVIKKGVTNRLMNDHPDGYVIVIEHKNKGTNDKQIQADKNLFKAIDFQPKLLHEVEPLVEKKERIGIDVEKRRKFVLVSHTRGRNCSKYRDRVEIINKKFSSSFTTLPVIIQNRPMGTFTKEDHIRANFVRELKYQYCVIADNVKNLEYISWDEFVKQNKDKLNKLAFNVYHSDDRNTANTLVKLNFTNQDNEIVQRFSKIPIIKVYNNEIPTDITFEKDESLSMIIKKYPLLKYLDNYNNDDFAWQNYVNLIKHDTEKKI